MPAYAVLLRFYLFVTFIYGKIEVCHKLSIAPWGVYVELEDTHIEGMSYLRDIEGEWFDFDPERYELRGQRTGVRLTLGDRMRVKVVKADLEKRQLDFEVLAWSKIRN